jgi:hypothetical protein
MRVVRGRALRVLVLLVRTQGWGLDGGGAGQCSWRHRRREGGRQPRSTDALAAVRERSYGVLSPFAQ